MTEKPGDHEFVFRRNDSIGSAAAEEDSVYLQDCFVDLGDLESLQDCADPKRIIVGRTGAGKSALLAKISASNGHVIHLSPQSLSLNYIANNQVIRFFEDAGVSLSPFYILLWKHIFVVELLRAKYEIRTEDGQRRTMDRLRDLLYRKDHIKQQAVEYLETWGKQFWLTTDERMRELTEKVEKSLSGTLAGSGIGISATAGAGRKLTSEERIEVVERGKRAVNTVQIRELESIIHVLNDEIFNDPQDRYYLTIDALDEEWTEDKLKFRLIKALIDTIRNFRRVENVKIIVAARYDLLDKVLHATTDPGFQEEKYESMYLFIKWGRPELATMLERRLNSLVRRRYTSQPIPLKDFLPNQIDGQFAIDYLLDRTFLRPRDIILLLNDCIACADGKPRLTASIIKAAEEEYSRKRLQSLAYEWQIMFPNLKATAQLLFGMPASFPLSDITKDFIEERYVAISTDLRQNVVDQNCELLNSLYTPNGNFHSVRSSVIRNLHMVGLIGIKAGPTASIDWASQFRAALSPGELRAGAIIHIHPTFYRALGTKL